MSTVFYTKTSTIEGIKVLSDCEQKGELLPPSMDTLRRISGKLGLGGSGHPEAKQTVDTMKQASPLPLGPPPRLVSGPGLSASSTLQPPCSVWPACVLGWPHPIRSP